MPSIHACTVERPTFSSSAISWGVTLASRIAFLAGVSCSVIAAAILTRVDLVSTFRSSILLPDMLRSCCVFVNRPASSSAASSACRSIA